MTEYTPTDGQVDQLVKAGSNRRKTATGRMELTARA